MSTRLVAAKERERASVMREVSAIAVRLFDERGYRNVTMQEVAAESGLSIATLYRRFTTKENLVCWQSDEQTGMSILMARVRSGQPIHRAATELARELPDEEVDAIEATARIRLRLITEQTALQAAAREKAESFVQAILEASDDHDQRPILERETEIRCIAAALDAANQAWLRGEGSLRDCSARALELLGSGWPDGNEPR